MDIMANATNNAVDIVRMFHNAEDGFDDFIVVVVVGDCGGEDDAIEEDEDDDASDNDG